MEKIKDSFTNLLKNLVLIKITQLPSKMLPVPLL